MYDQRHVKFDSYNTECYLPDIDSTWVDLHGDNILVIATNEADGESPASVGFKSPDDNDRKVHIQDATAWWSRFGKGADKAVALTVLAARNNQREKFTSSIGKELPTRPALVYHTGDGRSVNITELFDQDAFEVHSLGTASDRRILGALLTHARTSMDFVDAHQQKRPL